MFRGIDRATVDDPRERKQLEVILALPDGALSMRLTDV